MRKYLVEFKRIVTKLCEKLDNHSYVVAIWNGISWQIAVKGIDNRKLAIATRNVVTLKRGLDFANTRVMTQRFAEKHGID